MADIILITTTLFFAGMWLISRWYWRERYLIEKRYSEGLTQLFEANHPFRIARTNLNNGDNE